jgi:RES domain-containing protein
MVIYYLSLLKKCLNDIFKRFAKVFEQTYTRFLDLLKAEAQINLALERVRAKALVMHKSEENMEMDAKLKDEVMDLDIPDNIEILELENKNLPADWDSKPPMLETQFIGDDFVIDNEAAVLEVPSIVTQAFNYLINPNHPDYKIITVVSKEILKFNNRF